MSFNDRMIQFRLASRGLYNTYFYSPSRSDAREAEERFSNILKTLFLNMVMYPEKLPNIEYLENQKDIFAILKNECHRSSCIITVEIEPCRWEEFKIPNNSSLKLNFNCYFDWDDLAIKDNRLIKGIIASYSGNEDFVGKNALIEADDAIFQTA